MINGIPINDQSVTDGLHDFGQDFIQNIQMIEIYKVPIQLILDQVLWQEL